MEDDLILEIKNCDIIQSGELILSQVNFALAKAEFCYIIGKTGSGKSSLLKAIYGALPIKGGHAHVVSQDLMKLNHKNLPDFRRNLGMIFQDFRLFEDWTVQANLAYVLRATGWRDNSKIKDRIAEVLSAVHLEHKSEQKAGLLSGGEQQSVAIARAILNRPKLLIADEPTGNLDPDSSNMILHLLRKLAMDHKTAILVATHDYRLIEKFPARVFRCESGNLIEA